MNKTFEYFSFIDSVATPGVAKKVNDAVKSAEKLGFDAQANIFDTNPRSAIKFIFSLLNSNSNVVFVRYSSILFPFLFIPLIILRLKGTKVVVDVPTPRTIVLHEISETIKRPFVLFLKKSVYILSSSWVLFPANLVIQYADESFWFSFGVRYKTLKIGNGISFQKNMINPSESKWDGFSTLNLIAVAQIADWHGFDRLINALEKINFESLAFDIKFTIVGGGDALAHLKSLVLEKKLEQRVTFTGFLTGEKLNEQFKNAHIGISSLALYRKNLNEASDLKTREYMSRGLTVIGTGNDPDFEDSCPYRLLVPNNNSVECLVNMLTNLQATDLKPSSEIQSFAENKLSMVTKVKLILSHLEL